MADEDKKELTVICDINTLSINATGHSLNFSVVKNKEGYPKAYRLARKKDGTVVLQGAYYWSQGLQGGIDWDEIPMVDFDTGKPIFT